MQVWNWDSRPPTSGIRNAWTRIKKSMEPDIGTNFGFFRRDPNDFLSWIVTVDETWLYRYESETKQQSIYWGKAVNPVPEISSENSRRDFSNQGGILIIDYFPKGQTLNAEYYSTLWRNWWTIWRENAAEITEKVVCSCTKILEFARKLQPRRNWPTWSSSFSITHAVLWIYLGRTTICSLDWTEICYFRPTR